MAFGDALTARLGLSDRRPVLVGMGLTVAIHIALAVMLITAGGAVDTDTGRQAGAAKMCDGIRCPEFPFISLRRGPDSINSMDSGVIEASIIPRLGLAQPTPGQLPRFLKYEQAAQTEEAVNIDKENDKNKEIENKAVKPKDAEVDRRRKKMDLGAILGKAPEDDDPRARPTALDKIVGNSAGSVYGSGTEAKEGSLYAAQVGEAIKLQFTVPPFLSDAQLKKAKVRIKVSKINAAGQILAFEILDKSPEESFNNAAMHAIKRFSQKDGGNAFLPSPDAKTLELVNSRGMVIDLDGSLFKR